MIKNKAASELRIVKVPLPVQLIRQMDEAIIVERGGFRTRTELVREAVENLLHEMDYLDSEEEPASREAQSAPTLDLGAELATWELEELSVKDLAGTAIRRPPEPFLIENGVAQQPGGPLLGLHNRDYVSIWALERLARYTANSPIPLNAFFSRVTRAAWYFGAQLQILERDKVGSKLSILLPTNLTKRPSAERGFQTFAIGTVGSTNADGEVPTSGPLFAWRTVQVQSDSGLAVALTPAGFRLLESLDGMSLDLPHSEAHASAFLAHLSEHAPDDLWGLDTLLAIVSESPERNSLVSSFSQLHPGWSNATASSVAQGYIARAREWGLMEQKLVEGRYWLTQRGRQRLSALQNSQSRTDHQIERSNPNA